MERDQLKLLAAGAAIGLAAGFLMARSVYIDVRQPETTAPPNVMGPAAPGAPASAGAPSSPEAATLLHQQIDQLVKQVKANPQDRPSRVLLGNITFDNGMFDLAAKYYEEALALDGKDPAVITDLGVAYRNIGQAEKGVEHFERAVALDASHIRGWYNIAVVAFHELKQVEKARAAIAKVVELDPSFPGAKELKETIEKGAS